MGASEVNDFCSGEAPHLWKRGQREEEKGDDEEGAVGVALQGRESPQRFEGSQRGIPAQASRGREVDGKEAHRQGLEKPRTGLES